MNSAIIDALAARATTERTRDDTQVHTCAAELQPKWLRKGASERVTEPPSGKPGALMSRVVRESLEDGECAVELLKENNPCEFVRKRHLAQ